MLQRRDMLKLTAAGLLAGPASAQPAAPAPFNEAGIAELARALAGKPYKAQARDLPDPFASLTYEQYVGIAARPEAAVWAGENAGFVIEPLHRGFLFAAAVDIHLVEGGQARRLAYDPAMYDFGALKPPAAGAGIGFSGFRILLAREGGGPQELAVFQGASFYRAIARAQPFGVMARALSIRTGDPRGEEFPQILSVWIERPAPASQTLVIHALIDSESASGAYRFTLRPGEATIVDTECTLFARAAIDHLGIAGMSGSWLYGPIDRRRSEDLRPGVYELGGLQILTGRGEWLWRPVANRDTLQISAFADANPRGFGFLQRERDFAAFQDDDQHWERRPSLWIEPIGDWGEGSVHLVEIPSESEANDNIIAYWRPKAALAAGATASFAYRQFWCWTPPERPAGAIVSGSRGGRTGPGRRRRFAVEFAGESLGEAARAAEIKPVLTVAPGTAAGMRVFLAPERRSLRVLFDIEPPPEQSCEIRLALEAAGKPASETWLFRWTP